MTSSRFFLFVCCSHSRRQSPHAHAIAVARPNPTHLARRVLCSALCTLACGAATAQAAETATLSASFSPDRLNTNTTVAFSIQIATATRQVPSPVTGVGLRLPAGLGLFTSTLGDSLCQSATLQAKGVWGCSPNSIMGLGSATVEVAQGNETLTVPVKLTIVMGPAQNQHTGLLFYAEGGSPIIAELLFPSIILGESDPFSSLINTSIAPIHTLPEGPDASLIRIHATIGPRGLSYSHKVKGRTVHYKPKGMAVPARCPARGFPFSATFQFEDGTTTTAATTVPCPR